MPKQQEYSKIQDELQTQLIILISDVYNNIQNSYNFFQIYFVKNIWMWLQTSEKLFKRLE